MRLHQIAFAMRQQMEGGVRRAVAADTGAIGGSASHEFHVLADSGEDGPPPPPAAPIAGRS